MALTLALVVWACGGGDDEVPSYSESRLQSALVPLPPPWSDSSTDRPDLLNFACLITSEFDSQAATENRLVGKQVRLVRQQVASFSTVAGARQVVSDAESSLVRCHSHLGLIPTSTDLPGLPDDSAAFDLTDRADRGFVPQIVTFIRCENVVALLTVQNLSPMVVGDIASRLLSRLARLAGGC